MKRLIQNLLIKTYSVVKETGVFSTAPGRRLFETFYGIYKRRLEAGAIDGLGRFVKPGTVVIDVGANIGFFTKIFCGWVSDGWRVIAIEPESKNAEWLRESISVSGMAGKAEGIEAAADQKSGTGLLETNPAHPGDHRIGDKGIPVTALTIDDVMAERGWPRVSLMKIDVQGAEERVIAGADTTIDKFQPALFIEIDRDILRGEGKDAETLLTRLSGRGYGIHRLEARGLSAALSIDRAAEIIARETYADFLFIAEAAGKDG